MSKLGRSQSPTSPRDRSPRGGVGLAHIVLGAARRTRGVDALPGLTRPHGVTVNGRAGEGTHRHPLPVAAVLAALAAMALGGCGSPAIAATPTERVKACRDVVDGWHAQTAIGRDNRIVTVHAETGDTPGAERIGDEVVVTVNCDGIALLDVDHSPRRLTGYAIWSLASAHVTKPAL